MRVHEFNINDTVYLLHSDIPAFVSDFDETRVRITFQNGDKIVREWFEHTLIQREPYRNVEKVVPFGEEVALEAKEQASRRDLFTMHAMQVVICSMPFNPSFDVHYTNVAANCVKLADAVMKELDNAKTEQHEK
jgi:hypothetical protein